MIDSVIRKYIESTPRGALLIDGKWGSGKTHYIVNDFDWQNTKYTITSISGLSTFNDVNSKLCATTIKVIGLAKNALNFAKVVGSTKVPAAKKIAEAGISVLEKISPEALADYSNQVVVIDDLERYQGTRKEVIRRLHDLVVEKHRSHIIYICNSTEFDICELDKEKYIQVDCKFSVSLRSKLQSFIDSLPNGATQTRLKSKIEHISSICNEIDEDNFRVVIRAIDTVHAVHDAWIENCSLIYGDISDENFNALLLCGIIASSLYASNFNCELISENLFHRQTVPSLKYNSSYYENDIMDQYKGIKEKLIGRSWENNFFMFSSVINHLRYGFVNSESIRSDGSAITSKMTDDEIIYQELINWQRMSDERFNEILEKFFVHVLEGKYSLYQLFESHRLITHLINDNAIDTNIDRVNLVYENSINKLDKDEIDPELLSFFVTVHPESNRDAREFARTRLNKLIETENLDSINKVMSVLNDKNSEGLGIHLENLSQNNILIYSSVNELISSLLRANNPCLSDFIKFYRARIDSDVKNPAETAWLNIFRDRLRASIPSDCKGIQKVLLERITR